MKEHLYIVYDSEFQVKEKKLKEIIIGLKKQGIKIIGIGPDHIKLKDSKSLLKNFTIRNQILKIVSERSILIKEAFVHYKKEKTNG
jgi:GH35 family endo-1,4-beta-xylanase